MAVKPFASLRVAIEERSVYRYGMVPPSAGDIIERDGEQVRITRVATRPPTQSDLDAWGSSIWAGDLILTLEYEPLEPV